MGSEVGDNLQSQLDEVEMLQSMFPDSKELEVDVLAMDEIRHWLDNPGTEHLPSLLEVVLKLPVEVEQGQQHVIEAVMSLGHEYPSVALPEVYIR